MNNGFHGFAGSIKPQYKIYSALLTQTSTNPPIATILENTLGDIVWTYSSSGVYTGTLISGFPKYKYFSPMPLSGFDCQVNQGGGGNAYSWYRINDNSISVSTTENGILENSPIEIKVYN